MSIIQASVLHGPKEVRLEARSLGPPASDEVQIVIRATGLCGSDVHYYKYFKNGDIEVKEPISLGHESTGTICQVGSDVQGLEVGDNVALEVGIPCGHCMRCRDGRYNICQEIRFRSSAKSSPHLQGTLQERINHPAAWCHKLPPTIHLTLGALLEPLSVAIHAFKRAQLTSFTKPSVLIMGAGTIGLLCSAICKFNNAPRTKIADVQADRVDFATANGFASDGFIVDSPKDRSPLESLEFAKETAREACQVYSETKFEGFDVVFECSGAEACLQTAIFAARPGGKVIVVGMGNPVQSLPISAAALREVDILGTYRYANIYPIAIDLMAHGSPQLPGLHKLITHSFTGLEMVQEAFETASKTHDQQGNLVLKTIVTFDPPAS